MDCLLNYIGLNHCSIIAVPESGLYINDLPGVQIENIDKIANEEQSTFVGVWTDVQKRALKRFKTDVINMFAKRYRIKQVAQTANIGRIIDTTTTTAANTVWQGFTIETNNETDTVVNSNLQAIHIQSISLYLIAAKNTTVKVFDLDLGIELYSYPITGAVGWNVVNLNSTFSANRIFVCYDATTITAPKLNITDMNLDNNSYFDSWIWTQWRTFNKLTKLRGAKTTALTTTVTDVTDGYNTFGLSAIFSIKCVFDNVVCVNKEHFAQSLLYCLGSELMTERINSSRINRWTTTDINKARELRKYFELKYKGGNYEETQIEGELKTAIDGIDLNKYDTCLSCNSDFQFVEARL